MLKIDLEPAFVLHSRPYQETSLLLELFTKNHGRFGAVAKGARRPKSRARGLLQAFSPLLVSCAGRGELLTLKDVDAGGGDQMAFLQGKTFVFAFYLNELLMRLLHRFDPHPELFDIYRNTLLALACAALETNATSEQISSEQITLRLFEKSLLQALGYAPQLTEEVTSGAPIDPDQFYLFDPERGPFLLASALPQPTQHQSQSFRDKHLRVKGQSLLAIAKDDLGDPVVLSDAKRLFRAALRVHLGERPLESRRLL